MYITTLQIQNFRNHRDTGIKLDRLNYFLGGNNSGKSSILAAIEYALTGRCAWTDRGGRGAGELVQKGRKTATVALEVAGLGAVIRSINPNTLSVAGESQVQLAQAKIYGALAAEADTISAALNTGSFVSMTPDEQRNFLFTGMGLRWDMDTVLTELQDFLAGAGHSPEEIDQLTKMTRPLYPAKITAGPEVLEAIEKRLRDLRRDTRRNLQRLTAARQEMVIHYPEGLSTADLPVVEKQHRELLAQRDRLLARLADTRQAEDRRRELAGELARTEAALEAANKELAALPASAPVDGEEIMPGDLYAARHEVETYVEEVAGLEALLGTIRQAIGALQNSDGRCPLAPGLIKCSMASDEKNSLLAELRGQAERLQEQLRQTTAELERARQKHQKLLDEQQRAARQAKQARAVAEKRAALQARLDTLGERAAVLRQALAEFEPLDAPDLGPLQEIDERLARGQEILETLRAARRAEEEAAALERDIAALQQEVQHLETLVKAFGPQGMKKGLLEKMLQPFTERVNRNLNELTEGTYQLTHDDTGSILVYASGTPLALKALSASEQFRVGIAIQEALAHFLGLRFLAIDGADILDQSNRDLLTGFLLGLLEGGEYDQALVFSTIGDVQPQNPGRPGVKMFLVQNGGVGEL